MWFKNLVVFQADEAFPFSVGELEAALDDSRCHPPGSQTMFTEGFAPPLAGQDAMLYALDDFVLLSYRQDSRMLPGQVVRAKLDEKVDEIQKREDRKLGRKEKSELKEQIMFELMPQAFIKTQVVLVMIDMQTRRVMVNASSPKKAEDAVSALRKALGSLPVAYANPNTALHTSFAGWLRDPKLLPEGFSIGDSCKMRGSSDEKSSVTCSSLDLSTEEVLAHLETGMVPVALNVDFNDSIEMTLTEKMTIKGIKPLDLIQENIDALDPDDAVDELKARMTLQGSVLRQSLDVLFDYFGVNEAD